MYINSTLQNLQDAISSKNNVFENSIEYHLGELYRNRGDWNYSIYDMAWILCIDFFPAEEIHDRLDYLYKMQDAEGIWGHSNYVPHSAVVDTLAVIMCLIRNKRAIPKLTSLATKLDSLLIACQHYPYHPTVGFEFLAPYLIKWIEAQGIVLSLSDQARQFLSILEAKASRKLYQLNKSNDWFVPESPLSFTAEIIAFMECDALILQKLANAMLENGAIGLSPAATAGVILTLQEHQQPVPAVFYKYLRQTFEDYQLSGFPNLHPITTSRRLWNVLPYLVSGNIRTLLQHEGIRTLLIHYYHEISFNVMGTISWDIYNTNLPDLDDTAVGFALSYYLFPDVLPIDADVFSHFRRKDGSWFCYPYELHSSPAAILHSIMALDAAESILSLSISSNTELKQSLLQTLEPGTQSLDQLCHDKWHATWTYGAQRWLSIPSVQQKYPHTVKKMVAEILEREQYGGWGVQTATLEETAYVVSGLIAVLDANEIILSRALKKHLSNTLYRAGEFLLETLSAREVDMPAIWISKNLYAPQYQIVSAVFDALYSLNHHKFIRLQTISNRQNIGDIAPVYPVRKNEWQ